jgi:hypothetical protein
MKMKRLFAIAVVLAAAMNVVWSKEPETKPASALPKAVGQKYDRADLLALMKNYLGALVNHNPKAVPFAPKAKFVENTAVIPIGEGLWITASGGPSEFQIYAADPVAQQVAGLFMMKENGSKDILLGVRLKIVNNKITEAEHLAVRDDLKGGLPKLQKPRPAFLEDLAPADRTPRAEMLNAGALYYVALTGENGKLAPFADDCERHENGMTTAGTRETLAAMPIDNPDPELKKMMETMAKFPKTCEGQISTGSFAYITDIKNRRVLVADEQKGLVVGFSMFWHKSDLKTAPIKGVQGVTEMPSFQGTFNLPAMHIYKIKQGKIYDIEAIGFTMPYGLKSGWE